MARAAWRMVAVAVWVVLLLPAAAGQEPVVLLDERWDVEQLHGDTRAQAQEVPDAPSGRAVLRITNREGDPDLRIRNAGRLQPRYVGQAPVLRLRYRTDRWDGRWRVELYTYFRYVSERTFPVLAGDLDGGGPDGRLTADGRWHTARATLEATDEVAQILESFPEANIPMFVRLRPVAGGPSGHETFVDLVEVIPSPDAPDEPAPHTPQLTYFPHELADWFTDPELRPMPVYDEGNIRRLGPEDDVQATLDRARPGDVFLLKPGVYHQRLTLRAEGTAERPVVLAAEQPGTVTLSGEPPEFTPRFEPTEHEGIFVAEVPWRVRWALADGPHGRNLFGYDSLEHLRARTRPTRGGGLEEDLPPEGFAWEDGRLYVMLSSGQDPRQVPVLIHRRYESAEADAPYSEFWRPQHRMSAGDVQEDATLLTVEGRHIRVGGLQFILAPQTGILADGEHITVHDCYFNGTLKGIVAVDVADLTVEHCEYSQYPFYQWLRRAREREAPWWQVPPDGVFVRHSGPRTRLRNNLAYEAHDTVRPHPVHPVVHISPKPEQMSEYAYNFFYSSHDECLELESATPLNLRVHHNVFMNAVVPLAISPVLEGPLLIDHNFLLVCPEHGINSALLKFQLIPAWRHFNKPTQGLTFVHNTAVNPRGFLYWTGDDHTFRDNIMENNILLVRQASRWRLEGFEVSPHNLYHGIPANELDHLEHLMRDALPGFVQAPDFPGFDPPGSSVLPLPTPSDPAPARDAETPRMDLHLRPDSPGINAGNPETAHRYGRRHRGEAPDLGAIEHGDRWRFPTPGPRWARGELAPWRPPLPPSLDPAWVGLQE